MEIASSSHLSYCTNIHPGETWRDVYEQLQTYVPGIKKNLCPADRFGLGLRLSNQASQELFEDGNLEDFKRWLDQENVYVFTMNGFPYGGFHGQKVKDLVHQPDWTTIDRINYTNRLFNILASLLPHDISEGSISTSPLSYKHWHTTTEQQKMVLQKSTDHVAKVVGELIRLKETTGKTMHLDIEPEPDGVLENSREVLDYFNQWLLPLGSKQLQENFGISSHQAETALREHIQLCYDICHFAVAYEDHQKVIDTFEKEGWKIGKMQISAALKANLTRNPGARHLVRQAFEQFNESTYLHQVVAKKGDGTFIQYPDLEEGLADFNHSGVTEWRTHFHVPIFLPEYQALQSTQDDIKDVLAIWKEKPFTRHLEVETYTWEVLPQDMQMDLASSIQREVQWVIDRLKQI